MADKAYDEADKAILQILREDILVLPCSGPTFAAVRSIGADRVIELRQTVDARGFFRMAGGPLRPGEADRLRRFEAQIRAREEELSWRAICLEHEAADWAEARAWMALLNAVPVSLRAAASRFGYLLEAHPAAEWDGEDLAIVARTFLDAA